MKNAGKLVISVNWEVAEKLGKEKFLKQHSYLATEHSKQLAEMFDKKFGKPKVEKEDK